MVPTTCPHCGSSFLQPLRCEARAQDSVAVELRSRMADSDGGLRRFVNVYLAGEDIRFLDGLDTNVEDGDEVTILPAVAGG